MAKINDTYKLNKFKKVDLYHGNDRYEESHIEINKHHKQLWLQLNDTYTLNK